MRAALLPDARRQLVQGIHQGRRVLNRVRTRPMRWARWTIPQGRFLRDRSRRKLIRAGNQVGKSWVAVADVVMRATKQHPFRPDWNKRRGPVHQLILCVTWSQSRPLQKICRSMLPMDMVASTPNWSEDKCWGKDSPTIVFKDGSTIRFATTRQGAIAQAGSKLHHILADEPTSEEVYRELDRRLVQTAGEITLSMTPVNGGDLSWLRGLCDDGIVVDHHVPMTEEAFTFEDGEEPRLLTDELGRPRDAAWIAEQRAAVLPAWAPIIIDGEWDGVALDAIFAHSFNRAVHVNRSVPAGDVELCLGVDHGTSAFAETFVLAAVDPRGEYPKVWILDCVEAPANSPTEQDARGIIELLSRHGQSWRDLDWACGDIVHYGGRRNTVGKKSNAKLAVALARELRLQRNQALEPPLVTAKTGEGVSPRGSVFRGAQWMHETMCRPGHFNVHPRADAFAQACERWKGGSKDPWGHLVDGGRYALDPYIRGRFARLGSRASLHVG